MGEITCQDRVTTTERELCLPGLGLANYNARFSDLTVGFPRLDCLPMSRSNMKLYWLFKERQPSE